MFVEVRQLSKEFLERIDWSDLMLYHYIPRRNFFRYALGHCDLILFKDIPNALADFDRHLFNPFIAGNERPESGDNHQAASLSSCQSDERCRRAGFVDGWRCLALALMPPLTETSGV